MEGSDAASLMSKLYVCTYVAVRGVVYQYDASLSARLVLLGDAAYRSTYVCNTSREVPLSQLVLLKRTATNCDGNALTFYGTVIGCLSFLVYLSTIAR